MEIVVDVFSNIFNADCKNIFAFSLANHVFEIFCFYNFKLIFVTNHFTVKI